MKKIISFLLASSMLLSFVSCGDQDDGVTSFDVNVTQPSEDTNKTDTTDTNEGAQTTYDEVTNDEITYPPLEDPEEDSFSNIVFKQVYGTGYNIDTPVSCSFIELYNISTKDIKLGTLSLSYLTDGDANYKKYDFESDAEITSGGRYLIKCADAVGGNKEKYDTSYEVIRIEYYDAVWDTVIDNKSVKLAITDKTVTLSPSDDISKNSSVYSYFIAQKTPDTTDRNVIDGLSKHKAAYRKENTISSGFKTVNYSTMSAADISDVRPQYSGGDRNTYISSLGAGVDFSHVSGFYDKDFELKLTAPSGYKIYYTTDGSDPRTSGKEYTSPLKISSPSSSIGYLTNKNSVLFNISKPIKNTVGGNVIKACAKKGSTTSVVDTNSYFVIPGAKEIYNVPFVSLSLDKDDFVSTDKGIYYTVMKNPFAKKERRVSYLEMFESDGTLVSSSYVELAMNGNGSLGMASKSMRIYFKSDADPTVVNNPSKLKYDIFEGRAQNGVTEYKRLILRNSGNDSSRSHLRDGLIQTLCSEMNVSTMAYRPSLVFVNGEFWGVYNIRERFDSKYFKEHFGVSEENLVMIEAPSPLTTNWDVDEPYVLNEGQEGDEIPYHQLADYVIANDMSNETHYKYVSDRMDIDSFIDFFVCSMYMCNLDWPTNNVKVWRNKSPSDPSGLDTKWRYVICDTDMGMGLEGDYDKNMFAHALNDSTVAGGMMCSLLENENFKNQFVERFTYAAEKVFTPSKALKVYDEFYQALQNVIQLHFDRWPSDGGSMSRWNSETSSVKEFIEKRPEYALSSMKTYFGIQPNALTVNLDLSIADLYINGQQITSSGYNKVFSNGEKVTVKIVPQQGYVFKGMKTVTDGGGEKTYTEQSITFEMNDRITVVGLVEKSDMQIIPTVVAGSRSIFVLDKKGNLYAWGENDIRQCGICITKTIRKPTLIMSGVIQVEMSRGGTEGDAPLTAILTSSGDVYTVGNNSSGQLGRGGDATLLTKINTNVKFKKVSAGLDHLLLLSENGDVYGCGNNSYGQLGANNYKGNVTSLTKIAQGVSDIAAGRRHSLYITNDGKLYALGDNRWTKISSSAPEVITTPYLLASDAAKVYAGQHNSLYINKKGELFYFGWRDLATFTSGQSNGKMNKIADKVASASIMDEHFVYLTNDGSVYGFGLNNYGQISEDKKTKSTPSLIATKCVSASAGTYYTAYITEGGEVIVKGSNKSGVIGNGSVSNNYTPPYTAMKIS